MDTELPLSACVYKQKPDHSWDIWRYYSNMIDITAAGTPLLLL